MARESAAAIGETEELSRISGGEITTTGGLLGAGIGGGYVGAGGTLKISGGTITASGGVFAPNDMGYGGSGSGTSDTIEITGGSVNTNGAGAVYPQPKALTAFTSTP